MNAVSVADTTSEVVFEIQKLVEESLLDENAFFEVIMEEQGLEVDFKKLREYSYSKLQKILDFLENFLTFTMF